MVMINKDRILATIVHISDLHFDRKFTTDENKFKQLLASIPYIKGICSHSYQAVTALALRVNQILKHRKDNGIPAGVIFTGDLTSSGKEEEMQVGTIFLRRAFPTGARSSVGLDLGDDLSSKEINFQLTPTLFHVPGNHDIWKRNKPDVLASYEAFFPGPFPKIWILKTKSLPIIFYGLNSMQTTLLRHRFARGRVRQDQLEQLRKDIEELSRQYDIRDSETYQIDENGNILANNSVKKTAIHIVFLHHPIIAEYGTIWDPSERLDESETVARQLKLFGADLVLAGHVHQDLCISANKNMPNHAIAGTATQQFSDRNFLLIDIYEQNIFLQVFEYDKETLQFIPNNKKDHNFIIDAKHPLKVPIFAG